MELNKSILVFRNTSGRQLINAAKCIYRVTVMERCEKRDLEHHCTSVCSLKSGLSVSDTNTQKPLCLVGEYSPVDRSWNKNRNDRFAVVTAASGDSELISFLELWSKSNIPAHHILYMSHRKYNAVCISPSLMCFWWCFLYIRLGQYQSITVDQ